MAAAENTQVVRDLYAAFGRGDLATACALVAEDVVWHLTGTVPHYSGTYKGPGGVAAFLQELTTTVGIEAFEPQEFVTAANRVLVAGWSRARVKTTGRTFNKRWVMAFTVRDGKITQFEEYAATQALAAAHEHGDQLK